MSIPSWFPACALALALGGCVTVGPDYQRPEVDLGIRFKEAEGWKPATPADDQAKGAWWRAFDDPLLDRLLDQVELSNQNVAQYAAQYRQALALTDAARADRYPSATLEGSGTRSGGGGGASAGGSGSTASRSDSNDSVSAELSLSWELDLWGKLRRGVEEDRASAQSSAAELANATLSAQSSLAQDYFSLRVLDQRIALYDQTIAAYQRYLQVVSHQYDAGQTSRADVAQAQTQVDGAQASRLDLVWRRAQYEHAIAILIGRPPAEFALARIDGYTPNLPSIPVGMPSALLERRPDIAAAERDMASANAAVGVAIAGYYPDLTLSASGAYQDSGLSKLFSISNRFWSLGPSLSQSLFDGGATAAEVAQARAGYDAQVASYRQTVLDALGEVEDSLVELRTLDDELAARRRAAQSAEESARVTYNQYREGMIDYLDVATTQQTSLEQRQSVLELVNDQLVASVQLVVALGGDWSVSEIP
ncbi:RND transporter [Halotalea alkalilenta]|uniref:RND transporter n=1 Tax=Halotalea alkalilenta TaxID=376489 RepID=A0A172YJV7_9GAMM|nr:RND transporter [Halotalea alkalilenta]